MIRFCLCVVGFGISVAALAVPAVLIVQLKPDDSPPAPFEICDSIASELQPEGRVVPIVWGLTDPVFRSAVEDGKIRSSGDYPKLSEAFNVAVKLHAEYVLATDLRLGQGEVFGAATLYKNGRAIWHDPTVDLGSMIAHQKELLRKKKISKEEYDQAILRATFRTSAVQVNSQFGVSDTVRSMARTWVKMINSGAFASLPKQPQQPTPEPGRGQVPVNPATNPSRPSVDNKWMADLAAALKAGDVDRAVIILRDAVDVEPLDVDRRVLLVKTLMKFDKLDVAAKEARRAAELMPEHLEFRSLAARAWIRLGRMEEAQADLNEAVSHAPDGVETRQLLADVAMAKGDYPLAIEHLTKAIAATPSGDCYYLRSVAYAMTGETGQAASDLKKAIDTGLSQEPQAAEDRYSLVAEILDDGLVSIGAEIRTLHQKAQVQRKEKSVQASLAELAKRVAGRTSFVSELPVPPGHETSHNRWVLAHKLLSQCLIDLASYMKSGDEDVLTDSRINLGEALKQGVSARLKFKDERQGTKTSDGKPG